MSLWYSLRDDYSDATSREPFTDRTIQRDMQSVPSHEQAGMSTEGVACWYSTVPI